VGGATTAAGLAGLIVAETKLYIYNLLVLDITKTKSESRQLPKFEKKNYLHTQAKLISQLVNKMCSQQASSELVDKL
jgi:hypothetical protein